MLCFSYAKDERMFRERLANSSLTLPCVPKHRYIIENYISDKLATNGMEISVSDMLQGKGIPIVSVNLEIIKSVYKEI